MNSRLMLAFMLFGSVFCLPILVPYRFIGNKHSSEPQVFQPLALVIQDPLESRQFRSISLDSGRNHAQTIEKQDQILQIGESLSLGITKTLLTPLLAINNRISYVAGQLPSFLAANGAVIGSAIATPIHLGTLAANNIAAGVTGTLVSIPIALGSGLTAQVVGVVHSGQELTSQKVAEIQQFIQDNAQHLLPPLAAIKGAHAMVHGAAMKTIGTAAQHFGKGLHMIGSTLTNAAGSVQQFANDASTYSLEQPVEIPFSENLTIVLPETQTETQTETSTVTSEIAPQ